MDFEMKSEQLVNNIIVWDFFVDADQGIVPILQGINEESQQASVAVYLQKDSTPQLAGSGQYVDWTGFLTQSINFGELDANVRKALNNAGRNEYSPAYNIVNNNLQLELTKVSQS